jgi:hypothetical protein
MVDDIIERLEGKGIRIYSSKLSVNSKIITSTNKEASVVKVSGDLVYWVSGKDDFGSDFVKDVKIAEKKKTAQKFNNGDIVLVAGVVEGMRGKYYSVRFNDGTISLFEEKEMTKTAKKSFQKKTAGTWALPFTVDKASDLEKFVTELKGGANPISEELYNLYGDDDLMDDLQTILPLAVKIIQKYIKKLLAEYKSDPEDFTEKLDPDAEEILRSI